MEVLIGLLKDCQEEVLERIELEAERGKKSILLDYAFYKDLLNNLCIDLSSCNIFLLDNTILDDDFIKNNQINNAYYPSDEKYISELLFNPIDLAVIGISSKGEIGANVAGDSHEAMMKNSYLGLGGIMKAKQIVFMLTGADNSPLVEKIMNSEETNDFPASVLMNHNDITALLDKAAASKI